MNRNLLVLWGGSLVLLTAVDAAQAQVILRRGGRFIGRVETPYSYSVVRYSTFNPWTPAFAYRSYRSYWDGTVFAPGVVYPPGVVPLYPAVPAYVSFADPFVYFAPPTVTYNIQVPVSSQQIVPASYLSMPETRSVTSFYAGPPQPSDKFRLSVVLPVADAQLFINNQPTRQQGTERTFVSPSLEPGTYSYDLKAIWKENGREVIRQRTVRFQPGQQQMVSFAAETGLVEPVRAEERKPDQPLPPAQAPLKEEAPRPPLKEPTDKP